AADSSAAISLILYSAKYSGSSPDSLMFAAWRSRYSAANLSNSASSIVFELSEIALTDDIDATRMDQRPDARARQGLALVGPGVAPLPVRAVAFSLRRMAHELDRAARGQIAQNDFQIALRELSAEIKTDEPFGM